MRDIEWQPVDTETVKMRSDAVKALRKEAAYDEDLGDTVLRLLE